MNATSMTLYPWSQVSGAPIAEKLPAKGRQMLEMREPLKLFPGGLIQARWR